MRLVIFLIFFTFHKLWAQQPIPYKVFTTENGLVNNTIYTFAHDKKGYLWITTEGGVSRFDGRNFHNYTVAEGLPSNEVFEVSCDNTNRIWVVSFKGVAYLDTIKDRFVYSESLKEIPFNCFLNIGKETSKMLFASHGFVSSRVNPDFSLQHIPIDSARICRNVENNDVFLFTEKALFQYYNKNNTIKKIGQLPIGAFNWMSASYAGNFFFTWTSNFIVRTVINSTKTDTVLTSKNIGNATIYNAQLLPFNGKNCLWVSTSDGIHIMDWKTMKPVFPKINFDVEVHSVFYDNEGNYWVATNGKGVYHYTNLNIKTWSRTEGINRSNINALYSNSDGFLIGVSSNLNLFVINPKGQLEQTIPLVTGGKARKIMMIKNDLYLMQEDRFSIFRNFLSICCTKKEQIKLTDFDILPISAENKCATLYPNKSIVQTWNNGKTFILSRDKKNIYRVGVSRCVYKTNIVTGHTDSVTKIERNIYSMAETDDGQILLGGISGLVRYDPLSKKQDQIKFLEAVVLDILPLPNKHFLLATNGMGVFLFKDTIIRCWMKEEGLPSNSLKKITASHNRDTVYITSDKGIIQMRFEDTVSFNVPPQYIRVLGKQYSFPTLDANDIQYNSLKHEMYIATINGIAAFSPEQLHYYSVPPIFFVEGKTTKNTLNIGQNKPLPYEERDIQFDFSPITFQNGSDIIYHYRLQKNGLIVTEDSLFKDSRFYCRDTKDGKYVLWVQCRRENDVAWCDWQMIEFEIESPLWRRNYFIAFYWIMGLIILILLASYWNWYVKKRSYQRFKQRQELLLLEYRALLAQMNPHFTFNALHSLQRFFLSDQKEDIHRGIYALDSLGDLMRLIFEYSALEFITLKEELYFLEKYMIFLKSINEGTNRDFNYQIDNQVEDNKELFVLLPPMLVQPLLENAQKYGIVSNSKQNDIKMKVTVKNNFIVFTVEDYGRGIKEDAENVSSEVKNRPNALKIIKERLTLLKSTNGSKGELLLINKKKLDETLNGTIAIISIPLNIVESYETND